MRLLYLFVEARGPICNAGFQPARNVAALTHRTPIVGIGESRM